MIVTLKRLINGSNLRTNTVTGELKSLPILVGHPIVIYAPPLESGSIRVVTTSSVTLLFPLETDLYNGWVAVTENSTYIIKIEEDYSEGISQS